MGVLNQREELDERERRRRRRRRKSRRNVTRTDTQGTTMASTMSGRNSFVTITALFCLVLLITPSDGFLKIGRKRTAADKLTRDELIQNDNDYQESAAERQMSDYLNDIKALKELKAIVDAKTLQARHVRDMLVEDEEKN